jgi:hypothetical protein
VIAFAGSSRWLLGREADEFSTSTACLNSSGVPTALDADVPAAGGVVEHEGRVTTAPNARHRRSLASWLARLVRCRGTRVNEIGDHSPAPDARTSDTSVTLSRAPASALSNASRARPPQLTINSRHRSRPASRAIPSEGAHAGCVHRLERAEIQYDCTAGVGDIVELTLQQRDGRPAELAEHRETIDAVAPVAAHGEEALRCGLGVLHPAPPRSDRFVPCAQGTGVGLVPGA